VCDFGLVCAVWYRFPYLLWCRLLSKLALRFSGMGFAELSSNAASAGCLTRRPGASRVAHAHGVQVQGAGILISPKAGKTKSRFLEIVGGKIEIAISYVKTPLFLDLGEIAPLVYTGPIDTAQPLVLFYDNRRPGNQDLSAAFLRRFISIARRTGVASHPGKATPRTS